MSAQTRKQRAKQILKRYPGFNDVSVLDLGGSRHFWEKTAGVLEPRDLVILNVSDDGASTSYDLSVRPARFELYDGKRIPYPDKHFDVVICNSVIEHVEPSRRQALVDEIRRVGKAFFIQTPAYSFPIETHFVIPFVHWLPRRAARKLVNWGLYALLSGASRDKVSEYFDEVVLLRKAELRSYAPDATMSVERFMGLQKSYTLIWFDADQK